MTILFLGDIVGKPGRDVVIAHLDDLQQSYRPDLVIANGENAAGGRGITPVIARTLLSSGIDVITLGNHAWSHADGANVVGDEPRVLRPANYPPGTPGRGCGVFQTRSGALVGIVNLLGRTFMEPLDCPFRAIDEIIGQVSRQTPILFVDFHAETTSEKAAFGWHCDGRVSAVVGTHTHVQTADERILPGGTAFLTDAGMCGPQDSVIGMEITTVVNRFRTLTPNRFKVADGAAILRGVVVGVDPTTGRARSIERIAR